MASTMRKTYSYLCRLNSFEERFEYLKLNGSIGVESFGFDRYLIENFYKSPEWKHARDLAISRDMGRDLGVEGYEIPEYSFQHGEKRRSFTKVLVHHINPITPRMLAEGSPDLFDLDNLITVSLATHNAIHYGTAELLPKAPVERTPFDTCPWRL